MACGVKVLRFSVGFGRVAVAPPARAEPPSSSSSALPLGGYVRMLDEREGAGRAGRACIVPSTASRWRSAPPSSSAGPAANLLLAVLLYAAAHWIGIEEPKAVLSAPVAGSLAERAGLRSGDWVRAASPTATTMEGVRSMNDLRWQVTQAVLTASRCSCWSAMRTAAARARSGSN